MLKETSHWFVYHFLALEEGARLPDALDFFVYDSIKIFLLLAVVIFAVSLARSYFPPERARRILSHKKLFISNIMAALLGVATPFCSCSAVPLFMGFVEAGVPLGVTFSFLIASPTVNEVAVVLLFGLFGWKITALYISAGLSAAVLGGVVLGKLGLEKWVEQPAFRMHGARKAGEISFRERLLHARGYTSSILKRVWLFIIAAIAIGGFMHGYVPEDFLASIAGPDNPFAVPAAVLLGVPLYSNAAGIVPIVYVLMEKGLGMGTVLAFMMAVTALSLPELIILRKVLKVPVLAVFVGIMTGIIISIGYVFNALL